MYTPRCINHEMPTSAIAFIPNKHLSHNFFSTPIFFYIYNQIQPLPYICLPLQSSILYKHGTLKLQFKRKGSWLAFHRHKPALLWYRFGFSHPLCLFTTAPRLLRFKKHLAHHGLIIHLYSQSMLNCTLAHILRPRPFNIYTRRGIRPARFWLLKRVGKESQYTHLKSKIF